jgi:hypothetical protein
VLIILVLIPFFVVLCDFVIGQCCGYVELFFDIVHCMDDKYEDIATAVSISVITLKKMVPVSLVL